ncbi:MAG: Ig-like domain-containing protein [Dysgonamonadaceae bacterium]|jgi:uncharacterized protein (TIGR02145 family)|nr:Ig-like domain-containing protein [Dysgonamonadaceae bacterium]
MNTTIHRAKAHRFPGKLFCLMLIAMTIVSFASCRKKVTGVSLDKTVLSLIVGDVEQLIATVEPMDAKGKSVIWTSSNANAAIVDNNGNITARASGNATITVTTNNGNKTATCEVTVSPDPLTYDEGVVINGIIWATCNVDAPGAFAANPEDAGMYYQWNRKVGWSSSDPKVNSNGGTTWDNNRSTGTEWELANDPCPAGWRVPSHDELQSLIDAGSFGTTQNGISGRIFGIAPNTVFLPIMGYRDSLGFLMKVGSSGLYWSRTQYNSGEARLMAFNTELIDNTHGEASHYGFSVRCVKAK